MMTKRLWIGLVICGAFLLIVGAVPSSATDCNDNLLGYSWQCKLENVDNHQTMNFELSFFKNLFNQSVAQIDIPSLQLEASGPFACEMHRKFFSRKLVSGRSFLASLFSFLEKGIPTLTLTGDSYRYLIVNGNGLMTNALNISIINPITVPTDTVTQASATPLANASAFVYGCGKPTHIESF